MFVDEMILPSIAMKSKSKVYTDLHMFTGYNDSPARETREVLK